MPDPIPVSTSGGVAPVALAMSGAPDGLSLTDNGDGTGTIGGTVATGASDNSPHSVTVTATDAAGKIATETFEWAVVSMVGQAADFNNQSSDAVESDVATPITGDADLRFDMTMGTDDITFEAGVIHKQGGNGGRHLWFGYMTSGRLKAYASPDGSLRYIYESTDVLVPSGAAARRQYRFTIDLSEADIRFYTRDATAPLTDNTGWTLEETFTQAPFTLEQNTTVEWRVGSLPDGVLAPENVKVHETLALDGIDGTVVSHFSADDFTVGDSVSDSAVSSSGETWTIYGGVVIV